MKVLIYTHEFPPFQGGIATSAKMIADILSTENEVLVCCPLYSYEDSSLLAKYSTKKISFFGKDKFKKIPIIQYIQGLLNIKETIDSFNPEKIIFLGEEAEIVGGLLNNKDIDQIVRIAGSGIESIVKSSSLFKIIPKLLIKRLYKNSKFLVAVSKNTQELMNKEPDFFDKTKVRLIYNGVENYFLEEPKNSSSLQELPLQKDDFVLLTVSRLLPRKGQDFVIRALAKINNKKIKYICIGEGRFKSDYIKLAEELGLKGNVFFLGGVSRDKICKYYDSANIFILCNRTWNSKIEGLPNVVLEGMSRSLPVIGSINTGTEELIQDQTNGFLVDSENVEDIALKINSAYKKRKSLDKLGDSAKLFIQNNFSYSEMKKNYLDLVRDE